MATVRQFSHAAVRGLPGVYPPSRGEAVAARILGFDASGVPSAFPTRLRLVTTVSAGRRLSPAMVLRGGSLK